MRVNTARKLDKLMLDDRKETVEKNWLQKAAEEADLVIFIFKKKNSSKFFIFQTKNYSFFISFRYYLQVLTMKMSSLVPKANSRQI